MTTFVDRLVSLMMSLVIGMGNCLVSTWGGVEEVDLWIVGAAVLAYWLTGPSEEMVDERGTEELRFRLVPEIRSWGKFAPLGEVGGMVADSFRGCGLLSCCLGSSVAVGGMFLVVLLEWVLEYWVFVDIGGSLEILNTLWILRVGLSNEP